MYQALFTIPLVGLFMVRNWIWRVVIAGVLLASFCAILLTFSRTSWIACGFAAGVILFVAWRHRRISRNGWLGLCLGGLLGLVVVIALSGKIITRLTKADDGASMSRIHLVMSAVEHITHSPFAGVGPGNFLNAKLAVSDPLQWAQPVWLPEGSIYKPRFIDHLELGEVEINGRWYFSSLPAHNKYLLVAAELGLAGLALFMWFQWLLLKGVLKGLRQTSDALLWWVGVGLLGAFAATLLEFMLELFYDDKTMLMPLFVNILMICFARIALQHQPPAPSLTREVTA
jgi:O-antigen ligase